MGFDAITVALLVFFPALWWISFKAFDCDLMCPAMLLMSGYTICAVVAFVAGFSHPHDYSLETLCVLVTGTLLFLIPSYAAYRCYASRKTALMQRRILRFHSGVLWATALLMLIAIAVTLQVYAGLAHGRSLAENVATIRFALIDNPDLSTTPVLVAVGQLKKCFVIVSYFFLYIWARNAAVRKTVFGDKLLLMNLSLSVLLLLTDGGRAGVVAFVCAGAGLWFIFDRMVNGTRLQLSGKFLMNGAAVMSLAGIGFYGLLWVLGRQAQAGDSFAFTLVWEQFQIYIGAPIPLLDDFLRTASIFGGGDWFGKESFYSLIAQLSKLQIVEVPLYSPHLEFRPDVFPGANCYTAYRSYVADFGYFGLLLCPILFSVLVNALYYAGLREVGRRVLSPWLMLYGTVVYQIFIDFERSCFLTYWLNASVLLYLAFFAGFGYFLRRLRWLRVSEADDGGKL